MSKFQDLTGQRFGRWTVLSLAKEKYRGRAQWVCRCDCGEVRTIVGNSLRSGNSKSCGCLKAEIASKRAATHKMSGERIYKIWLGMKKRCNTPSTINYHNYGGRGITVCKEWERFEPFYKWAIKHEYSDELTLDRIDCEDGYYPDNCRWVDMVEQANNKRNNHLVEIDGETHTIAEWSRITGLPYSMLRSRVNTYGYTGREIISAKKKWERKAELIEHNGKTMTMEDWAKSLNIPYRAFSKRISRYGTDYAIEHPYIKRNRAKKDMST